MSEHHENAAETAERPISLSRFLRTIRAYLPAIGISLACIAIGYTIIALLLYLRAPSQSVTTLRFRLNFEGAAQAKYPNGTRFSAAEIISAPVLLRVFNANKLDRFTNFPTFSSSIFVLESNAALEALASEYQARLSDTRLTAVDRERIQKEFELKRASLSKNEFSINYARTGRAEGIPESVVRKVLGDILTTWARVATYEQGVMTYRISVLTPAIMNPSPIEQTELAVAIQVTRSKLLRVLDNIAQIAELPTSELARDKEGMTLDEHRIRVEEMLRFRLEPLAAGALSTTANPAAAMRYIETQLAFDERALQAARDRANAAKETLAVYTNTEQAKPDAIAGVAAAQTAQGRKAAAEGGGETVMPQISDTFLDRLVALTSRSADSEFRQRLAAEYRDASLAVIPLEQAVAYDRQLLDDLRGGTAGGGNADAVRRELDLVRAEVRTIITKLNEVHQNISRHLNPSTYLYTAIDTPMTRMERARSVKKLALYGVLILLASLPVIILLCLIHNHIREEDEVEEQYSAAETTTA